MVTPSLVSWWRHRPRFCRIAWSRWSGRWSSTSTSNRLCGHLPDQWPAI